MLLSYLHYLRLMLFSVTQETVNRNSSAEAQQQPTATHQVSETMQLRVSTP